MLSKRVVLGGAIVLALNSAGLLANSSDDTQVSEITWGECRFIPEFDWPEYKCGTLIVPENYSDPGAGEVRLPFAVFLPFEGPIKNDALLLTGGGGPGSDVGLNPEDAFYATDWLYYDVYLTTLENNRRYILMDNRGVGSSVPRLDCPEVEAAEVKALQEGAIGVLYSEIVNDAHRRCKERLEAVGVDLTQYHAANAARDIEELRIHLDVEKLNLYGISYGSRVSLMYEQLYPSRTRALILDGVYPFFVTTEEDMAVYAQALDKFFELCLDASECRERYGEDFRKRFIAYLDELAKEPTPVTVTDPETLTPVEVIVTPDALLYAVFMALYDESEILYLPKKLTAIMAGGTDYLADFVRVNLVENATTNSVDEAAKTLYWCRERSPLLDVEATALELKKHPMTKHFDLAVMDGGRELCEIWGIQSDWDAIENYDPPDAPTLLFSGALDPTTPAGDAERLHEIAPSSWFHVWPNIAHGVLPVSHCADRVAAQFLNEPTENPLDLECLSETRRYIFER